MNLRQQGALLLLRTMPVDFSLVILAYWVQHTCREEYTASVVR